MEIENEIPIEESTDTNYISLEDYQCLDECFEFFPKIKKSKKIENFWKKKITEINKQEVKSISEVVSRGLISQTNFYKIALQSSDNYFLKGNLVLPEKEISNPTIINIHDYAIPQTSISSYHLNKIGIAQIFLSLRKHENFATKPKNSNFLINHSDNIKEHFLTQIYCDSISSLNCISNLDGIDENSIILHGNGIGSSICIFASAFSEKVKGLILDEISISSIGEATLNLDDNWIFEFKQAVENNTLQNEDFLPNLNYFDVLNFVENIKVPVLLFLKFEKENMQKTKQAFAFFNYLNCDKRVKIFLNDDIDEKEKIKNNFIEEIFKI